MNISARKFVPFFLFVTWLALFSSTSHGQEAPENITTSASIDINTAEASSLAKHLKGIGLKKAEAIVTYRETYGAFESLDELRSVKGIGESIIKRNLDLISIDNN